MDNDQERDYEEERYNSLTCPMCDGQHEKDELCFDSTKLYEKDKPSH